MKKSILIAMLCAVNMIIAQQKMICKSGIITFEASVPSFEEVKATNSNVTVVLNPETGEIASLALMKGFRFKVALMEEHFNENYIESNTYPKAIFRGVIENFDKTSLSKTAKNFTLKGTLTLRGKEVTVNTMAKISKTTSGINFVSNFMVHVNDFDIEIPSVVKNKLSNKVSIHVEAVLK